MPTSAAKLRISGTHALTRSASRTRPLPHAGEAREEGAAASVQLHAGELDDLAPLFGLVGDHLAEVLRGAGDRGAAEIGELLQHLRVLQRVVDGGIELLDRGARGPFRGAHAEPGA